ncbi:MULTISPECIES: hypothetical protein [Pseudomonas]|jgi:hypothetical protein|uniref:Uncharacterized protein n=1 Tax=Pseudomonas putida TaxID=303 RepID=A0A6B7PWJ5_PSEPU|nr:MULTISPECIES: hypothetical protein [Pseudomonas]MBA1204761.1 hypothetical protein [Pseudomonas capeferrum]QFX76700.1 hypothetical protein [Pseudomonas putida]
MLAKSKQPNGVKYNIQLLMNGWVVAALFWVVGSLTDFLLEKFEIIPAYSYGFWVKVIGWAMGGFFVALFIIRLVIYRYHVKMGKYL